MGADFRSDSAVTDSKREKGARGGKKLIIAAVAAVLLISVAAVIISGPAAKSSKYNKALELIDSGEHEQAYSVFAGLGDYKDVGEQLLLCRYNMALELYEDGEYAQASELFLEIEDYEDAREQGMYCQALDMFERGYYEKAGEAFSELDVYGQADEYTSYCRGRVLAEGGHYPEAVVIFRELGDFLDSEEQMKDCQYNLAVSAAEKGSYDQACAIFYELHGHRDSLEQMKLYQWDCFSVGDIILMGSYEQDGDYSKAEDIEWLVADIKADKALLVSKYVLDCQIYNTKNDEVTWENCTLRNWLSTVFLSEAFTQYEQSMIFPSQVQNHANAEFETTGGNRTVDYVYCFSIEEAQTYFDYAGSRVSGATDYAARLGASGQSWLRSTTSKDGYGFVATFDDAYIEKHLITGDGVGVRPVMWILFEKDE